MNTRERRGAITVMAGVSMVCLTVFGAVAIDTTRLFASRADLQTVADAGALAGAMQMLRDSSVAVDTATAYAMHNGLRLTGETPDSLTVTSGVWSSATGAFIAGADPADAMRVRVARHVNFLLAQILGGTGVQMTASATGWSSAPVNGSRGCVKPIMLPYDFLRRVVNPPSSTITPDDMRHLRELSEGERSDSFFFGDVTTPTDGHHYYTVNLPPIEYPSAQTTEPSQGTYQEYLADCKTTNVSAGDWVLLMPSGSRRAGTVQGLHDLCEAPVDSGGMGGVFASGSCLVGGSPTGIPMKVAFYDALPQIGVFTVGAVQVKTLGSFVMTHVDDEIDPTTGLPRATIRGYVTTQRDFGEVGSGASTLRRALIVQ